jgi:hypothetical protein
VWLIYRAFTAIPFIHLAPIKTTLPSYVEFALDIQVKVMILVAIVIGICIAVALVVRQRRQAVESCKNPFPQALLPQSVARPDPLHSSRKTPLMVESFLPARQQKPCLARGFRGESAPP